MTDTLFLCGRTEPVFAPVSLNTITNCSDSSFFIASKSMVLFNNYTDSLQNIFDSTYRQKCMQAYKYESFTVTHTQSEYHHTLYYYDQAGNLLKTVPPAGVQANYDSLWLVGVAAARAADQSLVPAHGLNTQYRYNTLNQVIAQQTPDAGQSHFWYDRLGRLAISQNARQKANSVTETNKQYSYTLYDYIGRITEVGQIANATSTVMTDSISRNESYLTSWITSSVVNKEQITQTVYDLPYPGFPGVSFNPLTQRNLRNRVSYTSYTQGANPAQYNQGTFYTYDIEGNVDTLLQDYGSSTLGLPNIMNMNGNRFKRMVYQYDLVSGKVNSVAYQPHQVDAFYHRYTYDAENRLILAETSQDSVYWDKEARYEYYRHGPLARVVIGDKMVQGMDYAYTLQGWLKGVNSSSLQPNYDMGRDGDTTTQNRYIGRDAYGFSLNYFAGDYSAIGTGILPFPGSAAFLNNAYRPLYNGNISSMGVNIGQLYKASPYGGTGDSSHWRGPMVYSYRYDQLNRITGMDAFYGMDQVSNTYQSSLTATADFKERIAYDANGNIQKYLRNNFGETGLPMDSLGYKYQTGTNKLTQIRDSAADFVGGNYDLHNQPVNNYAYDSIGNLIKDSIEHINGIKWNVYGKIIEIDHATITTAKPIKNIYYYYDAAGNRIGKKTTRGDSTTASYTWYVRDASGNVMATYTASEDTSQALSAADLHVGEKHIYGSSRLGILSANYSTDATTDGLGTYVSPWTGINIPSYTGKKQYELTNHLGNVLATISDKKIGVSLSADSSLIDHYEADVQTAQDYYPFGMIMPGRMFTALTVPGGSVSGTTTVNGFTVPVDLALTSRTGNEPTQYVASRSIDLDEGFESGVNDDVTAYIADTSYAGGGNGGSEDGIAGTSKYRYGFNGKEKDDEVKGVGDQIDYGMRVYDPRAGRFLSVDPLQKKYPDLTTYQFAGNDPIESVDLDGLERTDYRATKNSDGSTAITFVSEGPKEWKRFYVQSVKIPFHAVIEYSGQHYVFADRGPNGAAAQIPDASGFSIYPEAVNYASDIDKFKSNPDEFTKNHKSLEQVNQEWTDAEYTANVRMMVAEAIVDGIAGATLSAMDETEGKPVTGSSNRQTNSANGGNKNAARSNASLSHGSEVLDISPMNESRLRGRELIIDENISPSISKPLQEAGFNIKIFSKGTKDQDIIDYAKQGNAIVLTNNIKDFRNSGVTAIKVTQNAQKNSSLIVSQLKKLSDVMKADHSVGSPGKVVSLANPQ